MTVHHDPAAHRFTISVDGHEAELDYKVRDGWMVITHTGVPAPIEDRGLASQLTRAAFEHAREQGWNVRPACPYSAAWAERHPEYSQLLG
jgi:predicted GNAT family acetyltransferase